MSGWERVRKESTTEKNFLTDVHGGKGVEVNKVGKIKPKVLTSFNERWIPLVTGTTDKLQFLFYKIRISK